MKTLKFLPFIFLVFLGFTSCSIEDDNEGIGSVEAHLLGKWDLEGHIVNGVFEEAEEEAVLEFKSGGVLVGHSDEGEVTGNYSLSGNQLALVFPGGGDIFIIETLTINVMKLYIEEDFDDVAGLDEVLYQFKKLPN